MRRDAVDRARPARSTVAEATGHRFGGRFLERIMVRTSQRWWSDTMLNFTHLHARTRTAPAGEHGGTADVVHAL